MVVYFSENTKKTTLMSHPVKISQVNPKDKIYTISRSIGAALHSLCRDLGLVAASFINRWRVQRILSTMLIYKTYRSMFV